MLMPWNFIIANQISINCYVTLLDLKPEKILAASGAQVQTLYDTNWSDVTLHPMATKVTLCKQSCDSTNK